MIMDIKNETKPRIFADFSIDAILNGNTTGSSQRSKYTPWGIVQHSDTSSVETIPQNYYVHEQYKDLNGYCVLSSSSVSKDVSKGVSVLPDTSVGSEKSTISVSDDDGVEESEKDLSAQNTFAWLTCTRFKPPKLPRPRKKITSRRHGRGPRIPFSTHQLAVLESTFLSTQYLSSDAICRLAETLNLTETRVKIWFQNRRARFRREKESPTLLTVDSPRATPTTDAETVEYDNCNYHHLTSSNGSSVSKHNKESFRHLINDLNLMAANAATVNINSKAIFYNLDQCTITKRDNK